MKTNTAVMRKRVTTHEGAPAVSMDAETQLRRSAMACMLWEDSFYESGVDIAARILDLVGKVPAQVASEIAIDARTKQNLRHASLWILVAMIRQEYKSEEDRAVLGRTIPQVLLRADEPGELIALYWKDGKKPLTRQMKIGIGNALKSFSEYQLAKYDRAAAVRLRDVLFLCHPKPKDETQAALFQRLANQELAVPDTWEVALSGGADKKETFERLMAENALGGLAFVRNLRNMEQSGVEKQTVAQYAERAKLDRVLPFRFIAAARSVPAWEDVIEPMMFRATATLPKLHGKTLLLVDTSPSMAVQLSRKSDLTRKDAAFGLAVLLREVAEDVEIWAFSTKAGIVPNRRGFALADAILRAVPSSGTLLGNAVEAVKGRYDRLIVITDEESQDPVKNADKGKLAYMLNVSSTQNAVGYGPWARISGWSESVLQYIIATEQIAP